MRVVVVWAIAACGRFGFQPPADARIDAPRVAIDAPIPDATVPLDALAQLAGTYMVSPTISYTCALGIVGIGVTTFTFSTAGATLTVTSDDVGDPQEPCTMTGNAPVGSSFSVNCTIPGSCAEHYALAGTSAGSSWTGTFTASFTGGTNCVDCTTQMFTVMGTQ